MQGNRGFGFGAHGIVMPKETKFVNLIDNRFDFPEKTENIEDPIVDYVLRCIKGIFVGRFIYINLTEDGESFGSDPEADLTMYIENSGLSPKHAEIKYENKKYYLKDLNSEKGTWILLREENPILIYEDLQIKVGSDIYSFKFSESDIQDEVEEWLNKLHLKKSKEALTKLGYVNLQKLRELNRDTLKGLDLGLDEEEEKIFTQALDDLEIDFSKGYVTKKLLFNSLPDNASRFEIGWTGAILGNLENADVKIRNPQHPSAPLELMIKYQYGHYWLINPYKSEESRVFVKLYKDDRFVLTPGDIMNMGDLELLVQRYNTGWFADKGTRPMMEDMSLIKDDIGVSYKINVSFYAVYDGHGGTDCVAHIHNYLISTLRNIILKGQPFDEQTNFYRYIHDTLAKAADETDSMFYREYNQYSLTTGSTAVVVIIAGDRIICANIGDARAVLSRSGEAINLSKDHKPDTPEEEQRIKSAGGFVTMKKVCGILATSRSFGDFNFKKASNSDNFKPSMKGDGKDIVSVIPEVREIQINYLDDEFIVVACDGLFDVFTSQQCVDYIRDKLAENQIMEQDPQKVAKELVFEAINNATSRKKHSDNVSVIIICLTRGIPPNFDKTIIK
jgi:protein phosphatase 2C family protein 2/3